MARVIKNTEKTIITCLIITKFNDGTQSTKEIKVGDIVENLRYVKNEEIYTVTGKVTAINVICNKVSSVDPKSPKNYFDTDTEIKSLTIDSSSEYNSKITNVPAREIIEDEGVENVSRIIVKPYGYETVDLEYSDSSVINRNIEINDVLTNCVIMNGYGNPDITGTLRVIAWYYRKEITRPVIRGIWLKNVNSGKMILVYFKNFISFDEATSAMVSNTSSLKEITSALNATEDGIVYASLGVDVNVPLNDAGKIVTTMVKSGKTLNLDLNGHTIDCEAYAFYVSGGVLNINDTSGNGAIKCHNASTTAAYPAIFVAAGGTCNMEAGLIDTTEVDTSQGGNNWLYGVACSGDGVFNMTGGRMKIGGAAGISITNGTATGEGAKFTIGGNAIIESLHNAAVYLADNKSVVIKDNAVVKGGMALRMGDVSIEDTAQVSGLLKGTKTQPLGQQVCISGVGPTSAAILALTGVYGSSLGNDMNIKIAKTAKVRSNIEDAIDVAMINTKYDQKVTIEVANKDSLKWVNENYKVYTHDELAKLAAAEGKTLGEEKTSTDLTIKIEDKVVYPVATNSDVIDGDDEVDDEF